MQQPRDCSLWLPSVVIFFVPRQENVTTGLSSLKESEASLRQRLAQQEEEMVARQCELQAKLDATLLEHNTLMDRFIEYQNRCTQLESTLETRRQEFESLQRIVLDLGRQNQTLQVRPGQITPDTYSLGSVPRLHCCPRFAVVVVLQIAQERLINRQWVADDSAPDCSNCQKEFSATFRKVHFSIERRFFVSFDATVMDTSIRVGGRFQGMHKGIFAISCGFHGASSSSPSSRLTQEVGNRVKTGFDWELGCVFN